MTALLRAELARARARPLVLGMLLLVLLGGLGLVLTGWWSTRPPSPAQVEAARVALAEQEQVVALCLEAQAQARAAGGPDAEHGCSDVVPSLERFLPQRPTLAAVLTGRLPTFGTLAVLAMAMTAAGLVTSEFRSGAIATWLTFAPRRGQVFLTKLAASSVAALVVALVPAVLTLAGLVAVCALNGVAWGVDGAWAVRFLTSAVRWLVVGLAVAAAVHGLAFAVRHAAAVTAVAVWWVATVESALPLVLPEAGWLRTSTNIAAFVEGRAWYWVPVCVTDPTVPSGETCELASHAVGAGQGALVGGVLVVLMVVVGWLSFRFRDVT
ncbi:conserved hypothetical protein [Cellulomonas flavigena DSM 20109]|uniref:Uncharacterized protein n=1 Tax=Cellulomonas flavigena (strain ATCC 482 / DSM 20109 / BCRC 11376 / JCM 18109 / NBRC 3775 / NCIMB 8073 / NRS 134) TaxID=446466 RepID=D5ULL9_CELFN|nr:ABC transporter permease subunit [Cellulomonas flavigena]ADG74061.1 conserved hypothetical protein [Cellulomonas flavigena DSM 20109]